MAVFSLEDINKMHHLCRINLINSCSSITHLGSNPALLGFFLRPTTVMRNTYYNIKATKKYTINHIFESILQDAHHTSAKYDESISEFDVTSLEEDYKDNFHAPFVKQSPIQIAMEYVEEYPIKANNTILVIGKIQKLYVPDELLEKDGFINLSKGKIATINGLDGYAVPKLKTRLDYQRPKSKFVNPNG